MTGKKIVIVGGGSASWISAFMFKSLGGCSDITVIEPEVNQPIGVGESTTPHFWFFLNRWCPYFDEKDFLKKTGSTVKLGVVHSDWKIGKTFLNPIDSLGKTVENEIGIDLVRSWRVSKNLSPAVGYEAFAIARDLVPFSLDRGHLTQRANYAYHLNIDNTLAYFKAVALREGIKLVIGSVKSVQKTDRISSVTLEGERTIEGDFFVDCTGQKRLLSIDNRFIEYPELLLNSALISKRAHEDRIPNYTLAQAMPYGWKWEIPVREEIHVGRLYNRDMMDEEKLLEKVDGGKIIRFQSGRVEKFLSGNVLSVGLSSGFVEPLEATSIHSTLIQLFVFLTEYFRKDFSYPNNVLEKKYNNRFSIFWDSIRDWIRMHYVGAREDSLFWKESARAPKSESLSDMLETYEMRMPRENDAHQKIFQSSLLFQVLHGMDFLKSDAAQKELEFYGLTENSEKMALKVEKESFELIKSFISHRVLLENI